MSCLCLSIPGQAMAMVCPAAWEKRRSSSKGGSVLLSVQSSRGGSVDAALAPSGAPSSPLPQESLCPAKGSCITGWKALVGFHRAQLSLSLRKKGKSTDTSQCLHTAKGFFALFQLVCGGVSTISFPFAVSAALSTAHLDVVVQSRICKTRRSNFFSK